MKPRINIHRSGAISAILCVLLLQACATTELRSVPEVRSIGVYSTAVADEQDNSLTVMTLNMAHGRGQGFHQLLQDTGTTVNNLDRIATMLSREAVDIVALQEADGPSFWSGNFSHVEYLAQAGEFAWSLRGEHVGGAGLSYGTALVSKLEPREPQTVTFDPSLSLTRKGFVVSTIDWPGIPGMQVDVVSVHLDFSSEDIRRKQSEELVSVLRQRDRPVIVMGDFNTNWTSEGSAVQHIASELGLDAYRPEAEGLQTFPLLDERLDWILVSEGLRINTCRTIDDVMSDHKGVVASIVIANLGNNLKRVDEES